MEAEIFDTASGRALAEVLPLEVPFQTWGDEFYFSVPMHPLPLEPDARTEMEAGDIAYWPEGNAVAIFFGPTPASEGERPVAYGPVNRIGRFSGKPDRLRQVAAAPTLRIEPA